MQLFNNGARKIVLKDQVIEPKSLFEIADKEGKKLMELFANEVIVPPVASREDKGDVKKLEAQIKALETQLADFEAIRAERDEAKKTIEKLEAQIEKLKR